MGIVDKVMGGLTEKQQRDQIAQQNQNRKETGPEALALGKPSEYTVDDRIGGTHTRNVKDAVVHENVLQHAHHEVTPLVNREREETEIHQKIQPVTDNQERHTHHQHVAPQVARNVQDTIREDDASRYRAQGQHQNEQVVGDQTHSTSVNAPIVREHVNRHIVEDIQPIINRQTQKVEHHHTTQQINESHVKAPTVHETVVNAPITMSEFAGKVGDTLTGHGSHGTHSHTGSSGLTGNSTSGGLTGNHHNTSSGLTGNNTSSGLTGDSHHHNNTSGNSSGGGLLNKLTGNSNNTSNTNSGLTGDRTTGATGDRSNFGHHEATNR